MRGTLPTQPSMFYAIDVESRIRADHPLRPIREIANAALASLTGEFAALYSGVRRQRL